MSEPIKNGDSFLNVLFVVVDRGLRLDNSAVFGSQVVGQMKALSKMGYKVGVLASTVDRTKFEKGMGNMLRLHGIKVFLIDDRTFFTNLFSFSHSLMKIYTKWNVQHIYVRNVWGYLTTVFLSFFFSVRYIYDVRGDLRDESLAAGTSKLKIWFYSTIEKKGIRNSYGINVVSTNLSNLVLQKYEKRATTVIPSCIEMEPYEFDNHLKRKARKKLGFLDTDIVFVYSGGLSHYQQIPKMIQLWSKFVSDDNIKFLLATNEDPHSLRTKLGDLANFGSKLTHVSVSSGEVPDVLKAANIGFLMRDNRELNRVASPVKFAEYLAAGLAVVTGHNVGDMSKQVSDNKLGVLIDTEDLTEAESTIRLFLKEYELDYDDFSFRARGFAASNYSWEIYKGGFRKLYGAIE